MCGGGTENDFSYDRIFEKWRGTGRSECDYDDSGNPLPDPAQTFNLESDELNPVTDGTISAHTIGMAARRATRPIRRRGIEENDVEVTT
jgi:hypothetical protein